MSYDENDEREKYSPEEAEEMRLIGTMVLAHSPSIVDEFMSIPAEAWSHWRAGQIAATIQGMFERDETVDHMAVMRLIPRSLLTYLATCIEWAASGGEVPKWADVLRKRATAKAVRASAERTLQQLDSLDSDDLSAIIATLRESLDAAEDRQTRGTAADDVVFYDDLAQEWRDWADAPVEHKRVIQTPWPYLDEVLAGGLHPKRSYLFAGRPGDGKSLSLTGIAAYAAERGYAGLLFSIEMDRVEIMSRMVSERTRSEYGPVTRREIDPSTRARMENYFEANQGMRLAVVDKPTITLPEIRNHARRMKRTVGLDFLCVDYVQLVTSTNSKLHRERQIAEISVGLRALAKELDIPVISAAQLNRDSVKDNRRPTMADLRDSGSLEMDADVIVLLHKLKNGDGSFSGLVEFIVDKNRTGKKATVTLEFRGHQARISNPESWRSVA